MMVKGMLGYMANSMLNLALQRVEWHRMSTYWPATQLWWGSDKHGRAILGCKTLGEVGGSALAQATRKFVDRLL